MKDCFKKCFSNSIDFRVGDFVFISIDDDCIYYDRVCRANIDKVKFLVHDFDSKHPECDVYVIKSNFLMRLFNSLEEKK